MTTDDNGASTWRDIADQLTGQQRAELEAYEHAGDGADTLLFTARSLAAENITDAVMFGDVPEPPDAERVHGWQCDDGGAWFREFEVSAALPLAPITTADIYVSGIDFDCWRCSEHTKVNPRAKRPESATSTTDVGKQLRDSFVERMRGME